jgi:hypothetical protein
MLCPYGVVVWGCLDFVSQLLRTLPPNQCCRSLAVSLEQMNSLVGPFVVFLPRKELNLCRRNCWNSGLWWNGRYCVRISWICRNSRRARCRRQHKRWILQSADGGTNVSSSLGIFLLAVGGYLLQSLHKLAGLFGTSNVECVGLQPSNIRFVVFS